MIRLYTKDVDGRTAVRMELCEQRDKASATVESCCFVTGLWADALPDDPVAVLQKRAENHLERPLTDEESATLQECYGSLEVKKKKKK